MISCRTLGPLVIKVNGEPPPDALKWKKPLALLIYMAFAPRQTRSKNQVMAMLWPDARKPSASLNQARYLLKGEEKEKGKGKNRQKGKVASQRKIGAVIAEDGDQLRIDATTVELDTTRFDQLIKDGRWADAVALIDGLFLEGFTLRNAAGFEEWLEAERAQWRRRCGDVLIHEAVRLMNAGAPELAEPVADRARRLLEHSDAAIRAHLAALALLGRRNEALEAGARFVKALAKDLGTKPESETVALIDAIHRMKKATAPPQPRPKPRAPLIGRSAQLERALGVWELGRTGEPGVVLVLGDEGMGKSRFAEEVMERARLANATVAVARGVPGDTRHPWIGLVTLAEGGLLGAPGVAGAPPAAIAALGAMSSLWAEKFPVKAPGEPFAFLQAMTEVIRVTALERPVLLVADDAQWMDGESLQALIGLIRSLAKSPVMVLVTASTEPPREELDQVRARIGRELSGVSVTLDALGHDDLVALARWAIPRYDDDQLDRVARRVGVESAGFPLIAHVILTAVADGMNLGAILEPWPRRKHTYQDELPVDPADNLVGALNVRFGRLSADAKAILRALAVLGGPCTSKILGRASDLPQARAEQALDELEGKQWVVADARGYAFLAWTIRSIVRKRQVKAGEALRIQERMMGT